MKLIGIACIDANRNIGVRGNLIYRIPEDMNFFKDVTFGYPIIMGRKTYEECGLLKGRHNIIVSKTLEPIISNGISYTICPTVDEAYLKALEKMRFMYNDMAFVIGGASIYKEFYPMMTHLYLTQIPEVHRYEAYVSKFPEYEKDFHLITTSHRTSENWKYFGQEQNRKLEFGINIYKRK